MSSSGGRVLPDGQEGALLVVPQPQKRQWDLPNRGQRWPSALAVWKLPNLPFTWDILCEPPSRSPHTEGKLLFTEVEHLRAMGRHMGQRWWHVT